MKKLTPLLLLLPVALLCMAQTAIIPIKSTTYTRNWMTNTDAASARTALGVLGSNNTSFNVNQFRVAGDGVSILTGVVITNLVAKDSSQNNSVKIGASASSYGSSSVVVGDGASVGLNSVAVGYGASATNSRSTAIGSSAFASNHNDIAIGYAATVSGTNSVTIGNNSASHSRQSVSVGNDTLITNSINCVVIGRAAYASNAASSVVVGDTAIAYSGTLNTVIGNNAIGASGSTAVGNSAAALASSTAIGRNALSYFSRSTAIGIGSSNTAASQILLGPHRIPVDGTPPDADRRPHVGERNADLYRTIE